MSDKMIRGYAQLPYANTEILFSLPSPPRLLYLSILLAFRYDEFVEDETSDKEWIIGKLKVRKADVIKRCHFWQGTFYRSAWDQLLKSGLIKEEKGWVILPRYRHKPDAGNGQSESTPTGAEYDEQKIVNIVKRVLREIQEEKGVAVPEPPSETPPEEREAGPETPESIVRRFYEKAGNEHTTDKLLEEGIDALSTYLNKGSTIEDIDFWLDWVFIPKNFKEKPYSFNVIYKTFGQAMTDKNKLKEIEAQRSEKEKRAKEITEKQKIKHGQLERNKEQILEYREKMTKEETAIITEQAKGLLVDEGHKEFLIDSILTNSKINKIIADRLGLKIYPDEEDSEKESED